MFNISVKTVLLYRADTLRTTTTIIKKSSGIYKQLYMQDTSYPLIRNRQQQSTVSAKKPASIWTRNKEKKLQVEIIKLTHKALSWDSQCKRKRGRPKYIVRRELETEIKRINSTWQHLGRRVQERFCWRILDVTLCIMMVDRHKCLKRHVDSYI